MSILEMLKKKANAGPSEMPVASGYKFGDEEGNSGYMAPKRVERKIEASGVLGEEWDKQHSMPFCQCGYEVQGRTVTKGSHAGSAFFCCGHPKFPERHCNYFVWKDPDGVRHEGKENANGKRNLADMCPKSDYYAATGGDSAEPPAHPQCQCDLQSVRRTVRQGPNEGKVFYVCPKDRGEQCRFYEWETDVIAGTMKEFKRPKGGGGGGGYSRGGGGGGGGGRSGGNACFKCKQEGHWASNCPNM